MGETSVCGDMVCDEDELTSCPQDCVAEITNAMCDCVVAADACDSTCIDIMDLGEKCSAYGVLGICGGVIPFDVKYSAYCGGCHTIPSGSSFQPTQVPSESDSTVAFDPTSEPSFTAGTSMHPTMVPTSRVSASLLPTSEPSESTADLDSTSVPSFTVGTSMRPTTVPTSRVSASLLPTSVPSDSSVQTSSLNTLTSVFGTPEPSDSAVVFEPTSVPSFSFGSSLRPTSEPSDPSFQTSALGTSQPSMDSTADLDPTSVPSFTVGTSMRPTTVPTTRVSASLLPTSEPSDSSVQTSGLNTLTSDFGTPEPSNFA